MPVRITRLGQYQSLGAVDLKRQSRVRFDKVLPEPEFCDPSFAITTVCPLPSGFASVPYTPVTLTETGGFPPFVWSLVSGSLPTGLTLHSDGVIDGTPTTGGTANFTLQVKDSHGCKAMEACSLTVASFPSEACGIIDSYFWKYNSLTGPFWTSSFINKFFALGVDINNAKKLTAFISLDAGPTWTKLDDSHAPVLANNIISFEARWDGATSILIATMEATTGRVSYHRVAMGTETWAVVDSQVIATVNAHLVGDIKAAVSIDKRQNGNVGVFYTSDEEVIMGNPFDRMSFKESSNDGTSWSAPISVGNVTGLQQNVTIARIQHGASDRFHFFFMNQFANANVQTLNNINVLSAVVNWAFIFGAANPIFGKTVSYNDGADKLAGLAYVSADCYAAVFNDLDTVTLIHFGHTGPSTTIVPDALVCNYPMGTLDFVSGRLYAGICSNHGGTSTWTYEQNSGDGITWVPNDETLREGAVFPQSPLSPQHSNSLFFSFGGSVYMANVSELVGDGRQGFQLAKVSDLPFQNPGLTVAEWITAC